MSVKRILFVCTGNSCRSVMAQAVMRHALAQAGLQAIQVDSAGVFAMDGMLPTQETRRVLQDAGLDCTGHRSRALTTDMVEQADLILVMELFQGEEVVKRVPGARAKTHLLKTYGLASDPPAGRAGIPDPIGKPLEVYEVCFAEIREAVDRLAKSLGLSRAEER